MQEKTIEILGPTEGSPSESVTLSFGYFTETPFTVNNEGNKRQLAPDVKALVGKAMSRYRMAVRMADGFITPEKVPAVTVTSIRDSRGQPWTASVTWGHGSKTYRNWCGEEFRLVFEK